MSKPAIPDGDIAALADGALTGARRAEVEQAVRTSREHAGAVAEQQRISQLVRAAQPAAPDALDARVRALMTEPGVASRRRRPRFPALRTGAAAFAAVAALVFALLLNVGRSGHPRAAILAVAALARQQANAGRAGEARGGRHQLARSVDGIAYPYWGDRGWREVGARRDVLAGHTVTTEFYTDAAGRRVAYSIASGPPLATTGGSPRSAGGIHFRLLNGSVLTWTRGGHTCVLSGAGVAPATLLALAAWGEQPGIPS